MKKLFTKLMAIAIVLLLGLSNMNAQTGVTLLNTNFEDWKPTLVTDQANGIYIVPNASVTITGPKFNNASSPNAGTNTTYPNYFRFGSAGTITNNYLDITPTNAFVNGGKITLIISTNATAGSANVFSVADKDLANVNIANVFAEFNQIGKAHTEVSVILPLTFSGNKTIRVFRTATTTFLHAIKIETNPAGPIISAFTVAGINATINDVAGTIAAELPYGTNLSNITPIVTLGGSATEYTPTGSQNFSAGYVTYTATNGTNTKNYAVTLTASTVPSSEKDLNGVTIGEFTPVFNSGTNNFSAVLPKASGLTQAVVFTIPVTASADFTSGITHDFSSPLSIIVTAQDATTKTYTLQATNGIADIAYVTATGTVGANDTQVYPDLVSKGYYVKLINAAGTDLTQFDNSDLVVLTEAVSSTNTLAIEMGKLIGLKPFLNMKAFMYSKANWPTGAGANGATDAVAAVVTGYSTHPIFAGVTFVGTNASVLSAPLAKGLQGVTTPGSGIVVAKLTSVGNESVACILEDNNVTTAKYLLIPIANDSYATINASGLKLIENAFSYLLGTSKFDIATGNYQHKVAGISFDGQIIHNTANLDVQVFDATGRQVVNSNKDINMSLNANGIYIVKSNIGNFKIVLIK